MAAQSDFRGLETGMSVAQAKAAAARNGMACETDFTGRTTCHGDDASEVLVTIERRGDAIWELQVSLAGHNNTLESAEGSRRSTTSRRRRHRASSIRRPASR